jgi:hypothetical protein
VLTTTRSTGVQCRHPQTVSGKPTSDQNRRPIRIDLVPVKGSAAGLLGTAAPGVGLVDSFGRGNARD